MFPCTRDEPEDYEMPVKAVGLLPAPAGKRRRLSGCAAVIMFPARGGMDRARRSASRWWRCVPRLCGDEPMTRVINDPELDVFPAPARLNRMASGSTPRSWPCSPRSPGWTADCVAIHVRLIKCFPRARGWTGEWGEPARGPDVFPAQAGTDQRRAYGATPRVCNSPRLRG